MAYGSTYSGTYLEKLESGQLDPSSILVRLKKFSMLQFTVCLSRDCRERPQTDECLQVIEYSTMS